MLRQTFAASSGVTGFIALIRAPLHFKSPLCDHRAGDEMRRGLLSYGGDYGDIFRRAASYVDRILRGAKPGDLPVQFPTKYELILNLKTAKALGLTIPETLLATADEVIQ
jgi:ABC-type uncharacterized transport system substrate-binding protein